MREQDYDDTPYVVIEQQSSGIGSFLLGIAIGAGAALLFAPQSGPEIRRVIGSRARELSENAKGMVDEMTGSIQHSMMGMRSQVNERIREASGVARRSRRQVRDAIVAGRSAAHEARAEMERKLAEQKTAVREGDAV
jgi:gas vesicle protein